MWTSSPRYTELESGQISGSLSARDMRHTPHDRDLVSGIVRRGAAGEVGHQSRDLLEVDGRVGRWAAGVEERGS